MSATRKPRPDQQGGATRYEAAVCAILLAVLSLTLLHYVRRYQAEAERAAVVRQVANLRGGLLSRVLSARIAGDLRTACTLAGTNPVALLATPPLHYLGESDHAEQQHFARGSWYFDRKQRKLVYLFTGNKSFFEDTPERWAFKVECICLPTDNAKPPGTPGTIVGVALNQVDG